MQTTTTKREKRGPGRPRREEQVQERRRKRRSGNYAHGSRLGVREDMLDFDQYVYRWVHDPQRLFALTKQDDWEIMTQDGGALKEDSTDLGSAVSTVVGKDDKGGAQRGYLLRKLKTFYEDDQAEAQQDLDSLMEQLSRGTDHLADDDTNYVRRDQIRGVR